MAIIGGDEKAIRARGEAVRETDSIWDWDLTVIPGTAARDLNALARGIYGGAVPRDDSLTLLDSLMRLQQEARANAMKRVRDLQ